MCRLSLTSILAALLVVLASSNQTHGAPSLTLQFPLRGSVSVIGYLPGEGDHVGRDLYAVDLASDDLVVYPTAPGEVVFSGWNCDVADPSKQLVCYGNAVAVDHMNGYYSIYSHLALEGLPITGDEVGYNTAIGTASNSGCFGDCGDPGIHLHFAVRQGAASLSGKDVLFLADTPVNIWTMIPGLPGEPSHTTISNRFEWGVTERFFVLLPSYWHFRLSDVVLPTQLAVDGQLDRPVVDSEGPCGNQCKI